jgi:hypothetical protein
MVTEFSYCGAFKKAFIVVHYRDELLTLLISHVGLYT